MQGMGNGPGSGYSRKEHGGGTGKLEDDHQGLNLSSEWIDAARSERMHRPIDGPPEAPQTVEGRKLKVIMCTGNI
jgi:hypothetical protein